MIRQRWGRVVRVVGTGPGITELVVDVDGRPGRAVLYHEFAGPAAPGDRVLLNTTGVDLGLGSGGVHFVVAVAGREEREALPDGHLMKLRYTPAQIAVRGWEEGLPPGRDGTADLGGLPVVVGELHSQLAPVVLGARGARAAGDARPPRIAYIMTDGGALPAAFSRQVRALREAGLISAVITAGHAFGGDIEAVSVHSAMIAARAAVGADLAVVLMGPGILGTGTALGFSGVEQSWILDAAGALGGRPVAVARVSFADPRERHRGLSHHTRTNLGRLTHRPAVLPLPAVTAPPARREMEMQLVESGIAARHQVRWLDAAPLEQALAASPVPLESMGRGYDDDPVFFLAAAAAGWAAMVLS